MASNSPPTSPTRPSRSSPPAPRAPTPTRPHHDPSATLFRPRPPPTLHLTVRFSASLPDLHLDILRPDQTTIVALKHLIRARLSAQNAQRRLRFIHGGRILPDAAVLSRVLRAPPPPPPIDPAGKGKHVQGAAPAPRVYVNCSIGDELAGDELDAEARAAAEQPGAVAAAAAAAEAAAAAAASSSPAAPPRVGGGGAGDDAGDSTPRGFDRLLAAGLTAAEVNQLRLQFRSIQAARYTPDTMPSPDTLRGLEDAWMDNNAGGAGGGAAAAGGDGEEALALAEAEEAGGLAGVVDVLVRGMLVGFLFPLGSVGWLIREEGLWSSRWQVFVSFGFVLSLTVGLLKALAGDK